MDLYRVTYVYVEEGRVNWNIPPYHFIVCSVLHPEAFEKTLEPWFKALGLHREDWFRYSTIPLECGGKKVSYDSAFSLEKCISAENVSPQ